MTVSINSLKQGFEVEEPKRFNLQLKTGPKLERVDLEYGRKYITPEGNSYPSITTVLKHLSEDAINEWIEKVGQEKANRISRFAATRGKGVHSMLENYIFNKPDFFATQFFRPEETNCFKQLRTIIDRNVNDVHAIEMQMYSDRLKIAGTVDFVADWNNEPAIIDFKTSMKTKRREWLESYFLQMTAYSLMWEEHFGQKIDKMVNIIANDLGKPQVFIESRSNWVKCLIKVRKEFYKLKGE